VTASQTATDLDMIQNWSPPFYVVKQILWTLNFDAHGHSTLAEGIPVSNRKKSFKNIKKRT
jgi:hypothetical protein